MNKRVNISLPETTLAMLDQAAAKGGRSRVVDEALRHYLEIRSKSELRDELRAGYQTRSSESLAIAADWFELEEEAWGHKD